MPRLGGVLAPLEHNIEPLVAGFTAMYGFLLAQRTALLADDSPFSGFSGQYVRFIFRATHLYGTLLMHATRSACLHDGVEYTINLELLAAALMTDTERPASWPMLQAEREALLRNDIPSFGARTDGTALLLEDGGRIEDYFGQASYEALLEKVRGLSEADMAFQIGLIRGAIGRFADSQTASSV